MSWRLEAFSATDAIDVDQVGATSGGGKPFVFTDMDEQPECQVMAAVWALMAQEDVTEPSTYPTPIVATSRHHSVDRERPSHTVRLKVGTKLAKEYLDAGGTGVTLDGSWTVRGHWREQPYPSLGLDEYGKVRTQRIWINAHAKGATYGQIKRDKVIAVVV